MLKFVKKTAWILILFILTAVFVAFCVKFPHKVTTAKNIAHSYYYVYQGDKAYKEKNLMGAIENYKKALSYYPRHAKGNYNLANIFAVYEDYISALEYYEYAVKYKPDFINARIALGILLSEKFYEYDRAIREYNTSIEKAPFSIEIPFVYKNEDYISYNKAVAYYNMGLAYKWKSLLYGQTKEESMENLEKAANAYKNALNIKKDMYDAYFNIALSFHLLGDLDKAKYYYCKCINMRPLDYDAHYNMAVLLREQKNFLDAILELEKAALIMDAEGDGFKTRYIYDVLNETSSRLYSQEDYSVIKEKLDDDPIRSYHPTFVNGKIVSSEELDRAMLKNLRTCGACK